MTGVIAKTHLTNSQGAGAIAIVEFTDFQCPFCARHTMETLPVLKKALIDSGKTRYSVVNLPLTMHAHAVPAAEAAECAAEQRKYWEMHDLLFDRQKELGQADYVGYANALGLDEASFERCLRDDVGLAKVSADQKEAERLKVNSTPTLFIGRMRNDGGVDLFRLLRGAVPVSVLIEEVAKLKD